MKKLLTICVVFLYAAAAARASENKDLQWNLIQSKSKIGFQVAQDKAIISGSFKKFNGKINFDPKRLKGSKIEIEIDISSIETSLPSASETLQNATWFASKNFPKATFLSNSFSAIDKDKFHVDGNLTIKGKSLPATLDFNLIEYGKNVAHVSGKAKIKRSSFGVGDGDPAKANGVAEEVAINFEIFADR